MFLFLNLIKLLINNKCNIYNFYKRNVQVLNNIHLEKATIKGLIELLNISCEKNYNIS